MKTKWIIPAVTTAGLMLGVAVFAGFRSAAKFRRANETLQANLHAALAQVNSLHAEKQESARQLAAMIDRHGELNSRIQELEATGLGETASAAPPAEVKPYQVEAYLGRGELLGN